MIIHHWRNFDRRWVIASHGSHEFNCSSIPKSLCANNISCSFRYTQSWKCSSRGLGIYRSSPSGSTMTDEIPSYEIMMTSSDWNISALLATCAENSPHKGQWRGALMFSLICVWINDWVNNRRAGDLRRHRRHCNDLTRMPVTCEHHLGYVIPG